MPAATPEIDFSLSKELSVAFFQDERTYQPFTTLQCGRILVGCVEPRDKAGVFRGSHDVVIQGPGAGPGDGLDTALAMTAAGAEIQQKSSDELDESQTSILVTAETGMDVDKKYFPFLILEAHPDCKFLKFKKDVVKEIARPSEFTVESAQRLAKHLRMQRLLSKLSPRISDAAEVELDYLEMQYDAHQLLEHADKLYPGIRNVHPVDGQNIARVYVSNLLPDRGKDRNNKNPNPYKAKLTMGYHDSPAAGLEMFKRREPQRMDPNVLALKSVARLWRSAAAMTVITADILEDTTFLEVLPTRKTDSGLHVVERKVV